MCWYGVHVGETNRAIFSSFLCRKWSCVSYIFNIIIELNMESSVASIAPLQGEADGEVKPYKIHVRLLTSPNVPAQKN